MSRINVNLDDVEGGFETYPNGKLIMTIQESSKIAQSTSNNPMIRWIGKITEPEEYEGKLYSFQTSLLPQALFKLKQVVEALGVGWDEDGFELEDCFGLPLGVENQVRTFKNENSGEDEERNNAAAFFQVKG